jgi:hypothetical protein
MMGGANVGSDGFSSGACVRFKREDGGDADKWARAISGTRGRKERAAAAVVSADGPAHHGRKEREGEGERAERKRANGPK